MIQPRHSWSGIAWLVLALLFFTAPGKSFASLYTPQVYSKHGAVYARSLVQDESSGHYIYVEYDESGEQVPGGLFQVDDLDTPLKYQVYSGNQYRAFVTRYEELLNSFELNEQDAPELVERKTFEEGGYTTYTGDPANPGEPIQVSELTLRDDTVMVAIAPEKSRYSNDPEQLLLMEFPINPEEPISEDIRSLLIKRNETEHTATVVHPSEYNIGYLTGFFGENTNVSTSWRRDRDDKIYGPLSGVPVRTFVGPGAGFTDEQGKYSFQYMLPPCPGFTFDYTTPAYVELYYKRFNPQASSTLSYFLVKYDWDFCNGLAAYPPSYSLTGLMAQIDAAATISSTTVVKPNIDFPVDFMVLSGRAALSSGSGDIPLGQTRYDGSGGIQDETLERIAQKEYDLDGDGESDYTELGRQETDAEGNKLFVKTKEGETPEIQGVWLSGQSDAPTFVTDETTGKVVAETFPDITRLPDWSADFTHRALLSEISKEDLGDTDIYVFRESDGSLLMERKGLDENDMQFGVDEDSGKFFYTIRIVGSRGRLRSSGAVNDSVFENWQISEGVVTDSPLYKREADHLRPGERVRLISINRASGYLGSDSVELKAASDGSDDLEISFHIDDLQLLPPNLRVWAERQSKTELGMTKDELNTYLVGSEGAGMSDDEFIVIYTEWLDPHGMPLPAELEDYGYTARLARIVAENELGAVGSVDDVAIKPGKQMSLIRLPEVSGGVGNEHYYIQVSGQPNNRESDFSSGSQDGMLKYRPKKFVPVLAPVYDEDSTNLSIQTWNSARETDSTLKRPEPIYKWFYRPEYQFSVYDLEMREINRQDVFGETDNILQLEQPMIAGSDEAVQLLYDLTGPSAGEQQLNTLDAYSYGENKELVFAFGDQEVSATVGADGQIVFDDVSQLSSLTAEDYLSIRLYTNNDPENVLWEWAFDYLFITELEENEFNEIDLEKYYVTADKPEVVLGAGLLSYIEENPDDRTDFSLQWYVEGDGDVDHPITTTPEGVIHRNRLVMPTNAGSSGTLKVRLNTDSQVEAAFKEVVVIPGVPARIDVSLSGQAGIQGAGEITVTALVYDAHGNIVTDGTPVNFEIEGQARLSNVSYLVRNGKATATIKGGFLPEDTGYVHVTSGDAYAKNGFAISGVTAQLANLPQSTTADSYHTLTLRVTDASGTPQSGVFVDLSTTRGKLVFTDQNFKTDTNGELHYLWHTGWGIGEADLSARIGGIQLFQQTVPVEPKSGLPSNYVNILPDYALVIGDKGTDGTVGYDNVASVQTDVSFPYSVSQPLSVEGSAGATVKLALGSDSYPNRLAALELKGTRLQTYNFYDDTGQHKLTHSGLTLVKDHPSRLGSSLDFKRGESETDLNSHLDIAGANLPTPQKWRWKMAFKVIGADGDDSSGELISFDGATKIAITPTNEVVLTVATAGGDQTITGSKVTLNQWHNLVAEVDEQSISLSIDGATHSTPLAGSLNYGSVSQISADALVIGNGLTGRIADIAYYDMTATPILLFANGTEEATVTMDGEGKGAVAVKATGNFAYTNSSTPLNQTMVGIRSNTSTSTINVINSSEYQQLASLTYDILGQAQSFDRFRELYAGSGRNGTENLLAERLLAFVMDHTQTDIHIEGYQELTALKGVLSVLRRLPDARPVVPYVERLITYFETQALGAGSTLMYAAADELYKRIIPALKGGRVNLDEITLPFLVLGEMLDTLPSAADRLASSIVSAEDFNTWLRFLSLPAEGWVGKEPPVPPLGSRCGDSANYMVVTSTPELAMPLLPCRLTGRQAGIMINSFFGDNPQLNESPEMLTPILYEFMEHLPYADMYIRKYMFAQSPPQTSWLNDTGIVKDAHAIFPVAILIGAAIRYAVQKAGKAAVKKATKNLVSFMLGKSNSRVNPLLLLTAIGYLESRITGKGCGSAGEKCIRLDDEKISGPVETLENKLLLTILFRGRVSEEVTKNNKLSCGFSYGAHGAAFELFMTAFFHLLHEQGSVDKYKIIELQKRNAVAFLEAADKIYYKNDVGPSKAKHFDTYVRYTDIVLAGDNDDPNLPLIVELKSYQAHGERPPKHDKKLSESAVKNKFRPWNGKKGGKTTIHRQLLTDAVMGVDREGAEIPDIANKLTKKASDFRWYFQQWRPNRRARSDLRYAGNDLTKVGVLGQAENMTAFQYAREQVLRKMGKDSDTEKMVNWNLMRPRNAITGMPVNDSLYDYVYSVNDGGLEKRIKPFSLKTVLTEGLSDGAQSVVSADQFKEMLKKGMGLNDDVIRMVENAESFDELVIDHLKELGKPLAEELSDAIGVEPESVKKTYERTLEELRRLSERQGALEEEFDAALEKLLDFIPDSDEDTCH